MPRRQGAVDITLMVLSKGDLVSSNQASIRFLGADDLLSDHQNLSQSVESDQASDLIFFSSTN